ncbi:MAG: thioredoxin family protein, partial [Bacteroidota bacterium]
RTLLAVVLAALLIAPSVMGEEKARKVENFTLRDYNGVEHSLSDYKDAKAIVLMFIATQCPVSNAYNERMAALEEDYRGKKVVFLGINSNKQESVEEVKSHAKEKGLEFTILKDYNNVIADKLEASFTPEIYVVNSNSELLYHGRIDDSRQEGKVESKDLRKALDEILAGKPVSVSITKAFGCTIKRVN